MPCVIPLTNTLEPFKNLLPGMLFPLGFDAKLKHEKREKKKETKYIVSFMFHLNNTILRIVIKERKMR